MLGFLNNRQFISEEMDNFSLHGEALENTLNGLSNINRYLGNGKVMLNAIKPYIYTSNGIIRIVDLGCGGGDLLFALAKLAHNKGKEVQLIGIDGNPNIVSYLNEKNRQYPNLNFLQADILREDFKLPVCDILISTHFMYHFTDEDLIAFLAKHKSSIRDKVIISELERSKLSYVLFNLMARTLRFPRMILSDGLKAISRSFHKAELMNIIHKAGYTNFTISWKWAFRYLIEINLRE